MWDQVYGKNIKIDLASSDEADLNQLFSTNLSSYGESLAAKQALKNFYGLTSEKYLRFTIQRAKKKTGILSENMLILLEKRLDSVVYRMNFSRSVYEAKQMIQHGHIKVNGKKITFCNYEISNGDIISLTKKGTLLTYYRVWGYNSHISEERQRKFFIEKSNFSQLQHWNPCVKPIPSYLEVSYGKPWEGSLFFGCFLYTPNMNEILKNFPFFMNLNAVLQFYRN